MTQSPDRLCRLLLEDLTDQSLFDLWIGGRVGSPGTDLDLGMEELCLRFCRDCLSLSRDLALLRAVELVEPLLNIRPLGLLSRVSS